MLERFFDETGGMQLVVHSPYGGRINRALGLALRKKFCRTFNFELQAAATDDADRALARAAPQLPAERGAALPAAAHTVEDTLEHAILDSPMFQARWRWNLNRSLMVLRFRGGRRNPPPIQRMESDDLMAAVFPQAAACQENVTGPDRDPRPRARAPDHRRHAARGARRRRPARAARAASRPATVQVHFVDTTEPSVLAHEILTARPYAFLDDEEFQNRRTNAVHLRRGLAVDLAADRRARPRRHRAGARRDHARARDRRRPARPAGLARGRRGRDPTGSRCSTSSPPAAAPSCSRPTRRRAVVRDRARRRRRARASPTTTRRSPRVLRGHLEITGDHHRRRARPSSRPSPHGPGHGRARRLEHERLRAAGPLHRPAPACGAATSSGWRAGCSPACTPTRAAPVAAASSPPPRRTSCASCCAGSTSRPGTQLAGEVGLLAVVEQLQGYEAAAVAWEPELLGAGMRRLRPGLARPPVPRRRGRAGCGSNPPARDRRRARGRAVEGHADLGGVPRRPAVAAQGRARHRRSAASPTLGATAEIIEVLRERGACFAAELGAATNRLPEDVERAPVGRRGPRPAHVRRLRRHPLAGRPGRRADARRRAASRGCTRVRPRLATAAAGRWSLVPDAERSHERAAPRRPRRAGRGGGRAAAAPVGRRVPRPRACTTRCASRGATCSGRCAGSRTAAWCGAAAS